MKIRCLAVAMVFVLFFAQAALGEDASFVLMEKLEKQIEAGSGFTASIMIDGLDAGQSWSLFGGNGESTRKIDVKYIQPRDNNIFELILSLSEGEAGLFDLLINKTGSNVVLSSELLEPKDILYKNGLENMILSLLLPRDMNFAQQQWLLSGVSLFEDTDEQWQSEIEKALAPYNTKVDFWLQSYAKDPVTSVDDSGNTKLSVDFTIPASAIKAEMKQLLMDLLADDALLSLLTQAISKEESTVLLNPLFADFYYSAIDALPFTGDVVIKREFSMLGGLTRSEIVLPVPNAFMGGRSFTYIEEVINGVSVQSFALETDEGSISFAPSHAEQSGNTTKYTGLFSYLPAEAPNWQVGDDIPRYEGKVISVNFECSIEKTAYIDSEDNDKTAELINFDIKLTPDWTHMGENFAMSDEVREQHMIYEPLAITGNLLFKSGASRSMAVTMEGNTKIEGNGNSTMISYTGRSTAQWALTALSENIIELEGTQWQTAMDSFMEKLKTLWTGEDPAENLPENNDPNEEAPPISEGVG